MRVLITGAAGMLGGKLAAAVAAAGSLGGREVSGLVLADVVAPAVPGGFSGTVETIVGDLATPAAAARLAGARADLVYHLAAIVSGEAEADLDKGYRINLDGTRLLFDAIRAEGARTAYRPRVVFASSLAVFGAPFPPVIPDDFQPTPLTSYGTQKAMGELLLADYSRRGVFDGIGLRLPTIAIRPGRPNRAASGFFSGVLREPLAGLPAALPVGEEVRHWFASPRAAVGYFLHAATLDLGLLGSRPNLMMPGLSATVGDAIAALRRVAGPEAVALIRREPDEMVARIVAGWPSTFATDRATALGFVAERSFDEIIRVHIEDELGGVLPPRPAAGERA